MLNRSLKFMTIHSTNLCFYFIIEELLPELMQRVVSAVIVQVQWVQDVSVQQKQAMQYPKTIFL